MKNKILCFGLVLIFLASMCGCNAEKADVLESSDIADCSSSVSNTETSDETDTTVEIEPEKATETEKTSFEPTSESNEPETAPTESKKPVKADKTDIPAAPKTETETPKPEAPKPTASEETKEPEKPVQPEKEAPTEQPTEEVKPKTAYSPEVEYLKDTIVCSQCGKKLYRHATWSKREKWFCTNGCKNDIYIGDQEIFDAITDAFVKAKSNPKSVENEGKVDTYNPSLAIVRQNNEINRLMDQSKVQFQAVKKLILQCVEMKFECCSENKSESHTVYIKECLMRWNTDEAVLPLMEKIVDTISLEKDGGITITLINQAKIIGRR